MARERVTAGNCSRAPDGRPLRPLDTLAAMSRPRHILVLTDRDWTHPQGGGTGTNLYGQIARWVAWGHRVTVIAGDYPGAKSVEELAPNLVVHRMGTRLTVFPRAAWATLRGVGKDADVVLEVVNGIAFFTPLWPWLRTKPRVALVHHVHQDHYVHELGTPRPRRRLPARAPAAARPLQGHPRPHHLERRARGPHRARGGVGPHPRRLHGRRAGAVPPHGARRAPDAPLPRPHQAVQAPRGPARRARGGAGGAPGDRGRRRPPAGARGGDRPPRPARPRDAARLRRRGGQGRALRARVGDADRVLGRGLVPDRDGGGGLRHAERGAARRRPGGVDRRRRDGRARRDAGGARGEGPRPRPRPGARARRWATRPRSGRAATRGTAPPRRTSRCSSARRRRPRRRSSAGCAAPRPRRPPAWPSPRSPPTRSRSSSRSSSRASSASGTTGRSARCCRPSRSSPSPAPPSRSRWRARRRSAASAAPGRWARRSAAGPDSSLLALVAVAAASIILREPIAEIVAVPEHEWAAAAILPTGVLWLLLSVQRGALTGPARLRVRGLERDLRGVRAARLRPDPRARRDGRHRRLPRHAGLDDGHRRGPRRRSSGARPGPCRRGRSRGRCGASSPAAGRRSSA